MAHTNLKGKERKYTLTDEAHDFIKFKGGSRWLNDTILSIRAYEQNMR